MHEEKITMKPSTNDKAAGAVHQVKGAVKEKIGELTKAPALEANGRAEKNLGKAQKSLAKVEKAIGA
jgi:uncharacterized protein YjbJ (UPF0337 family)